MEYPAFAKNREPAMVNNLTKSLNLIKPEKVFPPELQEHLKNEVELPQQSAQQSTKNFSENFLETDCAFAQANCFCSRVSVYI